MSGKKLVRFGLSAVLLAGAGAAIWIFVIQGRTERNASARAQADVNDDARPISVKIVHPKMDKDFKVTVDRPADIEAYYRANLEAQVAGEVKWIRVTVGTLVEKGEVLVRLNVPDKWAIEKEKQNFVIQREREYALMIEKLNAAKIAVRTADANVELKRTLLDEAKADTRLKQAQFDRLDALWRKNSIDKNVRDEAERALEYTRAAELGAIASRIKAETEVADAEARVKVTEAEVSLSKQLIEVAKADHEHAAAVAGYANVKAPFKSAVVARHVDPGSFVQNASTGQATAVLTLERSDIVTVVMRVPDNFAPYVSRGTQAILELDKFPGVKIVGKVTRYAPSLVTSSHDRTMRVEVDLWNESPELYKTFMADSKNLTDLKDGPPPLVPDFSGRTDPKLSKTLLPGMYGKMTLILKEFAQVRLVPSTALIRSAGLYYMYVVRNGKAAKVHVQVDVDDGTMAHVLMVGEKGDIIGEVSDAEQVVVSNQEELSEGAAVNAVLRQEWGKK